MVDYDKKGLGAANSVMRIRDNGSSVSFMIFVPWNETWWNSAGYSWSGAGGSGSSTFAYRGGTWKVVRTITVTASGNVSWTINDTGTSGFGGPHTQTAYIQRLKLPPAPTAPAMSLITHTTARMIFRNQSKGNDAADAWQLHYGPNPTLGGAGNKTISSTGTSDVIDLPIGTTIYMWARGHNALGWGSYSARGSGKTLPGVKVKVGGVWKDAIPYVKVAGVWKPAVPYVKKSGAWTLTTA